MRLSKNFILKEFIPPQIYKKYGGFSINFIHQELPIIAQFIRDWFDKPITINNWIWNGNRKYSGLRIPESKHYRQFSAHTRGQAIDFIIKGLDSQEVQNEIIKNREKFLKGGITCIENVTNGWTHASCQWTNKNDLARFRSDG